MPRTVVLKNGQIVRSVPDDVTDQQVEEWYADREVTRANVQREQQRSREAPREGTRPSTETRGSTEDPGVMDDDIPEVPEHLIGVREPVVEDDPTVTIDRSQGAPIFRSEAPTPGGYNPRNLAEESDAVRAAKRYVVDPADTIIEASRFLGNEARRSINGELIAPIANTFAGAVSLIDPSKDAAEYRRAATEILNTVTPGRPYFMDENGNLHSEEAKTLVGKIAPYIAVGGPIYAGVRGAVGGVGLLRTAASALMAGQATEQLLTDPYEDTLFDAIESLTGPDTQSIVLDFLASDEDDSEAERRLKLAFQDATITGALLTIPGMTKLIAETGGSIANKLMRSPTKTITDTEASDLMVSLIKNIKRPLRKTIANPGVRKPIEVGIETTGGVAQVISDSLPLDAGPIRRAAYYTNRFFAQTFRSRGYFTKDGFHLQQAGEASRRALVQRVENLGAQMNDLANDFILEAGEHGTDLYRKAFAGDKSALRKLPKNLREKVRLARDVMDRLSLEILDSPQVTGDLRETIAENMGSYITRSYRAFTDKNWAPNDGVFREAQEEVANIILRSKSKQFIKVTEYDEAMKIAESELRGLLGSGVKEYNDFAINLTRIRKDIFKRKKDLTPKMRALLGEITDPADNLVHSVQKMSEIVYKSRWFESMEQLGKDKWLFSAPTGSFNVPVSGTNSLLDFKQVGRGTTGYYTTREMASALAGTQGQVFTGKYFRAFGLLKGTVQQMKTVYSHPTHIKNMVGGFGFRLANGFAPFSQNSRLALRTVAEQVKQHGDDYLKNRYTRYLDLGIVDTNTRMGEFRALIRDGIDNPELLSEKIITAANRLAGQTDASLFRLPEKVYLATDDYFKINTFEDYLGTLRQAFPDAAEESLERQAAEVVKNTIPDYNLVPRGIKNLRKLPMGNFVGFSTEILRTSFNIFRVGVREIKSGNSVLIDRGLKRLLGLTTMVGGIPFAAYMTQKMVGLDTRDKQRAVMEVMGRPWSENPTVFMRMDEEGKLYGLDMSSINPYNYVADTARNAIAAYNRGRMQDFNEHEQIADGLIAGLKNLAEPFGASIAAEPLFSAVRVALVDGKTLSGKRIEDIGDVIGEVFDAIEPGTLTALDRFYESVEGKPQFPDGEPRNPYIELDANISALRWEEIDPIKALSFEVTDFNRAMNEGIQLRSNFEVMPQELVETYRKFNAKAYEAQAKLYRMVKAAKALGVDGVEIIQQLKEEGVQPDLAENLYNGRFSSPRDARRTIEGYLDDYMNEHRVDREYFTMTWDEAQRQIARDSMAMEGVSLETLLPEENRPSKEDGLSILRDYRR